MTRTYDIAVLGATAAGYVAAVTLSKKGHNVVVLDTPSSTLLPTESPLSDWLPADVFDTCPILRKVKSSVADGAFRAVSFHSGDLKRQSEYHSRSAVGFFLPPDRLLKSLAASARKAGAGTVKFDRAPELDLREQDVVLRDRAKSPREVCASVLLIAQGSPADAIADLTMPIQSAPAGRLAVCALDIPLPPSLRRKPDKTLHVVAPSEGLSRAESGVARFGMFFQVGGVLHVRIVFTVDSASAHSRQHQADGGGKIVQFVRNLQQAGMLPASSGPAKLNLSKAAAAVWHPPGGSALEMETHLAKRTLLIGTAGGFASAMSAATLAPSIISAMIAADVANRALRSPQDASHDRLQETLSEYKDQWRDTLADRIRPPGTSIRMMLPMALTNKAMTARFAKAFLYGENI